MSQGTNKERLEQNNELLENIKTQVDNLPKKIDTTGTATPSDIISGKTATVNNVKITGTILEVTEPIGESIIQNITPDSDILNIIAQSYDNVLLRVNSSNNIVLSKLNMISFNIEDIITTDLVYSTEYKYSVTSQLEYNYDKFYLIAVVGRSTTSATIYKCAESNSYALESILSLSADTSGYVFNCAAFFNTDEGLKLAVMECENRTGYNVRSNFVFYKVNISDTISLTKTANTSVLFLSKIDSSSSKPNVTIYSRKLSNGNYLVGFSSGYGDTEYRPGGVVILLSNSGQYLSQASIESYNMTDYIDIVGDYIVAQGTGSNWGTDGRTYIYDGTNNCSLVTNTTAVGITYKYIPFKNTTVMIKNNIITMVKVENNQVVFESQFTNKYLIMNGSYTDGHLRTHAILRASNGHYYVLEDKVDGLRRLYLDDSAAKYYNTYNANAIAADIRSSKIVYNKTGKIEGTMPDNGELNITPSTTNQSIPAGYTSGGTVIGDANLIADNIKIGTSIFGVNGIYRGSEGGEGEVKLFETVDEMYSDPTSLEGDLALVYSQENETFNGVYIYGPDPGKPQMKTYQGRNIQFPEITQITNRSSGSSSGSSKVNIDFSTHAFLLVATEISADNKFLSGTLYYQSGTDSLSSTRNYCYPEGDNMIYRIMQGPNCYYELRVDWDTNTVTFGSEVSIAANVDGSTQRTLSGAILTNYPIYTDNTKTTLLKDKITGSPYTSGGGYLPAPNQLSLIQANKLLAGTTAYGNKGVMTGTMTNQGTAQFTPSTNIQYGNSGYYDEVVVNAIDASVDENIVPANIKEGISILGVTGTLPQGGSRLDVKGMVPTVNVENISVTKPSGTYTFTLNSDGFYESNNKGVKSSYALAKVSFTKRGNGNLTVEYINSGEGSYDYGLISNLDKTLSASASADSSNVKFNGSGKHSKDVQTLVYENVSAGSHYIYVKFIKDSSVDSGNDSLQVRIKEEMTGPEVQELVLSLVVYTSEEEMRADTTQDIGTTGYIFYVPERRTIKSFVYNGSEWIENTINALTEGKVPATEYEYAMNTFEEMLSEKE